MGYKNSRQVAPNFKTRPMYNPVTGEYTRLTPHPRIYDRFELKEDLTEDNVATEAYRLEYNFQTEEYEIDERAIGTLYSFTGWTGNGRIAGPPVIDGSRGWCVWLHNRWEVVAAGAGGHSHILGRSIADVTSGSITIDNITVISGNDPREDPDSSSEQVVVSNPFSFAVDKNGYVLAVYNITDEEYIGVQAECPA